MAQLPSLKVRKKGRRGNPACTICAAKETKYAYPLRRNQWAEDGREEGGEAGVGGAEDDASEISLSN